MSTLIDETPLSGLGFPTSTWDSEVDILEASRLSERISTTRAISNQLDSYTSTSSTSSPSSSSISPSPLVSSTWTTPSSNTMDANGRWGEVTQTTTNTNSNGGAFIRDRRMRGPTERANELWRRGITPPGVDRRSSLSSSTSDDHPPSSRRLSTFSSQRHHHHHHHHPTGSLADWRQSVRADPTPGGSEDNAWVEPWNDIVPTPSLDHDPPTPIRWQAIPTSSSLSTDIPVSSATTTSSTSTSSLGLNNLLFSSSTSSLGTDYDEDLHTRRAALRAARLAADDEFRDRQRASFSSPSSITPTSSPSTTIGNTRSGNGTGVAGRRIVIGSLAGAGSSTTIGGSQLRRRARLGQAFTDSDTTSTSSTSTTTSSTPEPTTTSTSEGEVLGYNGEGVPWRNFRLRNSTTLTDDAGNRDLLFPHPTAASGSSDGTTPFHPRPQPGPIHPSERPRLPPLSRPRPHSSLSGYEFTRATASRRSPPSTSPMETSPTSSPLLPSSPQFSPTPTLGFSTSPPPTRRLAPRIERTLSGGGGSGSGSGGMNGNQEVRRSSLAEALAHLGSRSSTPTIGGESALRHRSNATSLSLSLPSPSTNSANTIGQHQQTEEELSRTRTSRLERLSALRRERIVMQHLLGHLSSSSSSSSDDPSPPTRQDDFGWPYLSPSSPSSPPSTTTNTGPVPRSPTMAFRRRNLTDFLRGLSGGGRMDGIWDDGFFWGRDSVGGDPRNYLDDEDFDPSYESLLRLSERLGDVKPKGVSMDKLEKLRKFAYKDWPFVTRSSSSSGVEEVMGMGVASTSANTLDEEEVKMPRRGVEKEERCAVCLVDYEDDDECLLGVCGHGFHYDCLSAWLKDNSACPVCRRDHS